jgi:hypothetical protein
MNGCPLFGVHGANLLHHAKFSTAWGNNQPTIKRVGFLAAPQLFGSDLRKLLQKNARVLGNLSNGSLDQAVKASRCQINLCLMHGYCESSHWIIQSHFEFIGRNWQPLKYSLNQTGAWKKHYPHCHSNHREIDSQGLMIYIPCFNLTFIRSDHLIIKIQ